MNTKQFLTIFFFAVVGIVNVLGTFVTSGLAVQLPLLSATAGTLAFPLASLGVLKLAAAASLAGLFGAASLLGAGDSAAESSAYGYTYRSKRSTVPTPDNDAVFALVSSMDLYSCGKALICGLQAKLTTEGLQDDEKLLLTLFSDKKGRIDPSSPRAEYDLASTLGLASRDQVVCRKRYSSCPYTADEMMSALRTSQL